jgi:hypothetical protein
MTRLAASRAALSELRAKGLGDFALFEAMATASLEAKAAGRENRCPVCSHPIESKHFCLLSSG